MFAFPHRDCARKRNQGLATQQKIRLIESMNSRWYDLAERWTDIYKPESVADPREIPIRVPLVPQARSGQALGPLVKARALRDDAVAEGN
jgi:hypothetical protein